MKQKNQAKHNFLYYNYQGLLSYHNLLQINLSLDSFENICIYLNLICKY